MFWHKSKMYKKNWETVIESESLFKVEERDKIKSIKLHWMMTMTMTMRRSSPHLGKDNGNFSLHCWQEWSEESKLVMAVLCQLIESEWVSVTGQQYVIGSPARSNNVTKSFCVKGNVLCWMDNLKYKTNIEQFWVYYI